jgi:predicted dehydrogenase
MTVKMDDPVRMFVIGLSDYLRRYALPGLVRARGIRLLGVAVRDVARARSQLADLDVAEVVAPYEAVLAREDVDAVYICLPNALHLEWTLRALDSGKHVLCEKPMVLKASHVDLLENKAQEARLTVMEGLMYRFHPQWAAVQDLLASRRVGPTQVVISHYAYLDTSYEGPRFSAALGGGVLRMVGGYPVNAALVAFQEAPTAVIGVQRPAGKTQVDATTSAILEFPTGHAVVSASVDAFDSQYIRILGSEGMIEVLMPFNAPADEIVALRLATGAGSDTMTYGPVDQFQLEFEHFSEVVRGLREPAITFEESRRQAAVMDAIASSFARGGDRIELKS